jgi:hypothetical protein
MVICVQIFQGGSLLAKCSSADHHEGNSFLPNDNSPNEWACEGHVEDGRTPSDGPAVASALLVTSGDKGGFNTYTWTQSLTLKKA